MLLELATYYTFHLVRHRMRALKLSPIQSIIFSLSLGLLTTDIRILDAYEHRHAFILIENLVDVFLLFEGNAITLMGNA